MTVMDFSLWPAASRNWSEVLEGAEYAERTGWHSVWIADHFMQNGGRNRPMEDAVRDLVRGLPLGTFGIADVTDLPWIEIDFPEDVAKARDHVLPAIEPQIESGKSRP